MGDYAELCESYGIYDCGEGSFDALMAKIHPKPYYELENSKGDDYVQVFWDKGGVYLWSMTDHEQDAMIWIDQKDVGKLAAALMRIVRDSKVIEKVIESA